MVDTALVVVYALFEPHMLKEFVKQGDTDCNIEECKAILTSKNKLHVRCCSYNELTGNLLNIYQLFLSPIYKIVAGNKLPNEYQTNTIPFTA